MRTLVLIDGQNLYHLARRAWAPAFPDPSSPYSWPSYDVEKLASRLVDGTPGRTLAETRFYTGVPTRVAQSFWHDFWSNKLRYLRSRGVHVYRGRVSEGRQEKGVDVSLALDLVQATHEQRYEVAIIVSQDWTSARQCAWRSKSRGHRAGISLSSRHSPLAQGVLRRGGSPERRG